MWRTIDFHLRTMRLISSLSPSSSSSPLTLVRTIKNQLHLPSLSPNPYSLPTKALISRTIITFTPSSVSASPGFSSRFVFHVVRCISSVSPAQTFEWNEPISCSEVGDGDNGTVDEDTKPYIPVRAYFFSTRFDFYHFFF